MPEQLLAGLAVAAMLGINARTLDQWRYLPPTDPRRKNLPHVKVGSRIRYKLSDVENFIRLNTIDVTPRVSRRRRLR